MLFTAHGVILDSSKTTNQFAGAVFLIAMDIITFYLDITITSKEEVEIMKEAIKTYYVKFSVDTLHTEAVIKAYSKPDAETLLNKQYTNCKICITEINEISEERICEN